MNEEITIIEVIGIIFPNFPLTPVRIPVIRIGISAIIVGSTVPTKEEIGVDWQVEG